MSASNKLYKIRCKRDYPGFTIGCEYLGHIGYGYCGEVGMHTLDDDGDSRTLNQLVFPVSRSTWWKKYRVFYEDAIAELFEEEARAESEIKRVTRGE